MPHRQFNLALLQIIIVTLSLFDLVACNQTSANSQEQQATQSLQPEQSMNDTSMENEQGGSTFSTEHWGAAKIARFNQIVEQQIEMNAITWQKFQDHGVTEETKVRLDFFYYAPDKESAESLRQFLYTETDYDLQEIVHNLTEGDWSVNGTTQPTSVSPEILDQWVRYMVAVGVEYDSEFDGWGASIP